MVDNDANDNADDLVDKVYIQMSTLTVGSTFTAATTYNGSSGAGAITLQFRVLCQYSYYGPNCNTFCQSVDNNTLGHYTCGSNGFKICLPGWKNSTNNCLTREF